MKAKLYLENQLKNFLNQNHQDLPGKLSIEAPKQEAHGDMATNLALVLPRAKDQNPRQIAEAIKSYLQDSCPELAQIDIAGPGFINFTFTPAFWQSIVLDIVDQKDDFGRLQWGEGRKVQIEYVSANPTGPLHIGHGRGAAVGDSLTRILRFAGHEVHTEYYVNDAGQQMRLLGLAVWVRYQQILGQDLELPQDCYQGEYIKDIAQLLADEHGRALLDLPQDQALELCYKRGLQEILQSIKDDLQNFQVEHEQWFSEKSLVDDGLVEATLNSLLQEDLAYVQDGALWFRSTNYGDDKDRVLKKSDGSLTYFASDIAYHDHKIKRGFDLMIDIWGADHHGYVPRMQAAVQALGRDQEALQVILVQLVNLLQGGQQVTMSTRAGQFETLADVCAEVGVDAARFIFLSRKSDSPLDFDLDMVKQKTMDNPVYYVQYAHARICSLMAKAQEQGLDLPTASMELMALLTTPEDLALFKALDRFQDFVDISARTLSPHHLSYYLLDLAGLLHRYYNAHHILSSANTELAQSRILLFQAVAQVLKNGLNLLGVSAPQRM